jgi:DnaJ-like protein
MKLWTGFACLLLLAGSALAQGGELVGAEWGVPGRKVDVTARVRTFVHDGILQLEVTRFNLGIDPAPHENKVLVIRLREWDGDIRDYSYPERSVARLELDPQDWHDRRDRDRDDRGRDERGQRYDQGPRERGLRILRAYYGADGQFVNVTDALRSRVDDGRLFLRVDNYTMGVDPLPGAHKYLRILYLQDGERRHVVVDEKTNLRLP